MSISVVSDVAPLLAAGSLGVLAFLAARALLSAVQVRGAADRLARLAGDSVAPADQVEVGSEAYKVRLAFARYGIGAAGREPGVLWAARILLAAAVVLVIGVLGYPPLTWLAGPVIAWFAVDGMVSGAWMGMRRQIEQEVPTFLLRMSGTVQAEANVLSALEEVGATLNPGGPLQAWVGRFAARLQSGGRPAMQGMLEEGEVISPSLGLAVFEIARLWETGGTGYPQALAQAAENLAGILDGRAQAEAKAAGARRAILVVLGALVFVTAMLLRNPTLGVAARSPLVQIAYLVIAVWVAIGWSQVNSMIAEATT